MFIFIIIIFFINNYLLADNETDPYGQFILRKKDIHYVKQKYENTYKTISYLFYPANNSKRLIIFFSGAVINKYLMWSWFWKDSENWNETSYLFIKDDTKSFYIGRDNSLVPIYTELIKHIILKCNIQNNNIFAYGISMGATAALYYGLLMNLKGVILHDIFDPKHFLIQILKSHNKFPLIYLQHSQSDVDKNTVNLLMETFRSKNKYFIGFSSVDTYQHATCSPTKSLILNTIKYFELISPIVNNKCDGLNIHSL